MARERFVLLGLARARSLWFREVARWATSSAIPAEFVKCVSADELRAHLGSDRPFSAAMLDGGLPAVDRDLLQAARDSGCAPIVVDDRRPARDWLSLGAAAVLPVELDRTQLLDVLSTHARMLGRADALPGAPPTPPGTVARQAAVACVCGPGGTGASVAAMALAQQLAADPRAGGPVLLADLCLTAEQAMLHDARDVVPGVQELLEAHRGRQPPAGEIHALTFAVAERGYRLLLGLRRPRYWATIRPRAFEAAFESLRRAFAAVVCDVTADFEGEEQGGSADVEERNVMARTAAVRADAVLAVGLPGTKGLHALVRVVGELLDLGVQRARILPVVNQAPRSPRARAELSAALAQLTAEAGRGHGEMGIASPVFLPRRRVEEALRDGVALPAPLGPLLAGAFQATLARAGARAVPGPPEPQLVAPGSLGAWTDRHAGNP